MGGYTNITSISEFDKLVSSNTYVMIDFTATWCPPCKMIAPFFERAAAENASEGNVAFVKIDVDAQQELAQRFNITAMPTFILLKDGKEVQTAKGANPTAITTMAKVAVDGTKNAKKEVPKEEPKKEPKEEETVSGKYGMSSGANSHWKTSLR
jgi:thioredoxin 1